MFQFLNKLALNLNNIHTKLSTYRYELLLVALLLLIFDKIFFTNNTIYLQFIWPINMVLVALASFGIFIERNKNIQYLRNVLGIISVLMPFGFLLLSKEAWFVHLLTIFFIVYYMIIFSEVMYQITMTKEVRLNVIIGSFCGYLLLSMIALFSYIFIENNYPNSFHGITTGNAAQVYNELSYFSFITLTSIGFGDMYPITDMSRLTVAFFGMAGEVFFGGVGGNIFF